jgi:hypothetical protein
MIPAAISIRFVDGEIAGRLGSGGREIVGRVPEGLEL